MQFKYNDDDSNADIVNTNENNINNNETDNQSSLYKCTACNESFQNIKELETHFRNKANIQRDMTHRKKAIVCGFLQRGKREPCRQIFCKEESLNNHWHKAHIYCYRRQTNLFGVRCWKEDCDSRVYAALHRGVWKAKCRECNKYAPSCHYNTYFKKIVGRNITHK